MYIRVKTAKSKSGNIRKYAYLVSTKWRKTKTPKQKSKKYLGRVYTLEKNTNKSIKEISDFEKYLKTKKLKQIIRDLIKIELLNHNFIETKKNYLIYQNLVVDLRSNQIIDKQNNNPITIELNKNYLNSYTLNKLINYKPTKDLIDLQIGKEFATTFISAGIPIDQEVFISLFKEKMLIK